MPSRVEKVKHGSLCRCSTDPEWHFSWLVKACWLHAKVLMFEEFCVMNWNL